MYVKNQEDYTYFKNSSDTIIVEIDENLISIYDNYKEKIKTINEDILYLKNKS